MDGPAGLCNYLFKITSREAALPVMSTVVVRVGRQQELLRGVHKLQRWVALS
jgi:hypothetical protein